MSEEADKKKSQAKAKVYEKEYVRGSILDRNGNTIAFSQKPGGTRTYSHPYAFSNLVGYWSKIYGTYGVEKTMNDVLVFIIRSKVSREISVLSVQYMESSVIYATASE